MTDTHTTAHIPDEAVQAGALALRYSGSDTLTDMAKTVLTAALPHLSAPCAVVVRKLGEWRRGYCDDCVTIEQASTGLGSIYQVRTLNGDVFLDFPDNSTFECGSADEAKAAARADFERRILSCVVTKPVDVAALLNSAALIIEGRSTAINRDLITSLYTSLNGYEIAAIVDEHDKALGTAIRALSAEPAQGARPLEEWHEDHGNVVWWAWDKNKKEWLGEPAYIGTPLDCDWPKYHTHWTPHPMRPAAPTTEAGK